MGGRRKRPARATGPRCRGDTQVFACPIDRRLRLCSREGTQHLFVVVRRRSCVASGVLKFGGAAAGGGAAQARAVCAACWAACARVAPPLLCSSGRCCGGVCAATLVAVGARAVGGARAVDAGRARWVSCGGRGRPCAVAVGGAWRYRAGGVRASPLFLCSRCRRCCRWCSAPWPQTCPPGGWCMLTVSLAACAARRHAGRWRCWRGVGGRCRSWPQRGCRRPSRAWRWLDRG